MKWYALRTRLLTAGVLAMLFASCDLELPRRVQMNTAFGLHVPVGDIGELQEVQDALAYTSIDKIASLFDEETTVNVYYYTNPGYVIPMPDPSDENKNATLGDGYAINPGEVRSMLLHFPLTSLNLNFSVYLENEVTMPAVDLSSLSSQPSEMFPYNLPSISIPLGDMSKWIASITLNEIAENKKTTVTLEGAAALKDSLEMAIPDFGIGCSESDFKEGETQGDDLVFTATKPTTISPKSNPTVDIYLKLTKVPPKGVPYQVKVDLKWTTATVLLGDSGTYTDKITLPVGQFSEIATKYKIASIPCYLYVDGPFDSNNKIEFGLQAGTDWLVGDKDVGQQITEKYNFSKSYQPPGDFYAEELHKESASFNLAKKVNADSTDDLILNYRIKRSGDSWTVNSGDSNAIISADMVVVLPLQFNVEPQPDEIKTIDNMEYIDIFSMVEYGADNNSDLFGRDQIGSTTAYLSSVRLSGKNMENTFFSNDLFLHVYEENVVDELIEIKSGGSFSLDIEGSPHIPMPFHPEFSVYLQKPEIESAVIKITPKSETGGDIFTIQIAADVTGMAEYEQDL